MSAKAGAKPDHDVQVLMIGAQSEVEAGALARALGDQVTLTVVNVTTWAQFRQALQDHAAPIVHIVARASDTDAVEFEDAGGVRRGADPDILAACREALAPVKLVILDGNYSGLAGWWLEYVDAVIDIPTSVPVADREEFLAALYHALDSHTDLVEAFRAFPRDERIELLVRDDNEATSATHTSARVNPGKLAMDARPGDGTRLRTLRELLLDLRKGHTQYKPILIGLEPGRVFPAPGQGETGDPDLATQYAKEFAGHAVFVVEPNTPAGLQDASILVGRAPSCDVCIEYRLVSRKHASILFVRGEFHVVDQNSQNGTFINGKALVPGALAPVQSGDRVDFADTRFVFIDPGTLRRMVAYEREALMGDDGDNPSPAHTRPVDVSRITTIAAQSKATTLCELLLDVRKGYRLYRPVLIEAWGGGHRYPGQRQEETLGAYGTDEIWRRERMTQHANNYTDRRFLVVGPNTHAARETPVILGRSRRCDVCIEHDSVSKTHATIAGGAFGEYHLVDEYSSTGTCINGEKLPPGEPTLLGSGDFVSFGEAFFLFLGPDTLGEMARLVY